MIRNLMRGTALAFPLPANASADLVLAGYHGYPIRGSNYFGPSDYYETAAYIGVLALVLACVARLTEITVDIGAALAPWPAPKSTQRGPFHYLSSLLDEKRNDAFHFALISGVFVRKMF